VGDLQLLSNKDEPLFVPVPKMDNRLRGKLPERSPLRERGRQLLALGGEYDLFGMLWLSLSHVLVAGSVLDDDMILINPSDDENSDLCRGLYGADNVGVPDSAS
jgi:hypothetical protein